MRFSRTVSIDRSLRASLVILLLLALFSVPSYSGSTGSPGKIQTVDLPGLSGAANNVAYVDDRYVLVAPFAPNLIDQDTEADDLAIDNLDNHYLYLIDTKKPDGGIRADLKTCYFPTRVLFDPASRTVFVRGTEFYTDDEGIDSTREVIVHLHLNLSDDVEPFFDPPVTIPIEGHDSEFSTDAPSDFVLGHKGKILAFTNGKSIFTYNLISGEFYPVHFDDDITFMDLDEETNTLFVSFTDEKTDKDGRISYKSELRFSRLREDGTVDLIKHVRRRDDGTTIGLVPRSNVAIASALDSKTGAYSPDLAYFIDSTGTLCRVDLKGSNADAMAEALAYYPDLEHSGSSLPSARKITYDRTQRMLGIVKSGFFREIKRPTMNRPGRIKRPTMVRASEASALILVQLNKKNRIVREKTFTDPFVESGGLSNLVLKEGKVIVAGFNGDLYSIDLAKGLGDASLAVMGDIGDRVDFIASAGSGPIYVAINSFEFNEDGLVMINPGSLSVVKFKSAGSELNGKLTR